MARFAFPQDDLDDPDALATALGGLWGDGYGDAATCRAILGAAARLVRDADDRLREFFDCFSLETVPVHSRRRYARLPLLQSLHAPGATPGLLGDEAGMLGTGANPPVLGGASTSAVRVAVPRLVDAPAIADGIADPGAVWTRGVDYTVENGELVLYFDPFTDPRLTPTLLPNGDVEIILWLWRPAYDDALVRRIFGDPLEVPGISSAEYRKAVSAVWRTAAQGSSAWAAVTALSAGVGIPMASGPATVEDVADDGRHLLIVTDREVLRHRRDAAATVAAGEALKLGDAGVAASGLADLTRGRVPDWAPLLVLGPGWFDPADGIVGGLVFANADRTLTIADGVASFPVTGSEADVAAFWAGVRRRETESGVMLLDLIESEYGYVPLRVNPARVIASTSLRHAVACFGVGVTAERAVEAAARLTFPPHVGLLRTVQLPTSRDSGIVGSDRGVRIAAPLSAGDTGLTWADAPGSLSLRASQTC